MRSLIKNHKLVAIMVLSLLVSVFVFASYSRLGMKASDASLDANKEANHETAPEVVLACPGRVEGASEVINVGAGADGVIAEIRVFEGQAVRAGEVLAVIDRRDLIADLSSAHAQAEVARQARARIVRGSRDEERRQAEAEVSAVEATLRQSQLRYDRYEKLCRQGVISEDQRDESKKNLDVAEANLRAAVKHKELVDAPPLPEELERADAEVRAADERMRSVTERLEKVSVKAPISGTVLKTFMRPGETFSTFTPQPILSMADISSLRVRAEVDERDIGRTQVGQRVMVQSDSFQGGKLMGTVKSIGSQMGRKKVRTGDPAEKADRDILEVLIDLDEKDRALVVGLRVTARFLKLRTEW
ncbi:MAG TPA: efflux RND transporter periplasmic adaptor subunit [Blastocatellia bacterium]|nr:efflux RND transporter periplasmic adaptor subunit [Blastocatellia bacterium]